MDVPHGGSGSADRNWLKHLEILHAKVHCNNVIKKPGTFNVVLAFSHCLKSSHAFACCFSISLCFAWHTGECALRMHWHCLVKDFVILCAVVCCQVERTTVNTARRTDSLIKGEFSECQFSCPFCDISSHILMVHGHFCRWPHVFLIFWALKLSIQT